MKDFLTYRRGRFLWAVFLLALLIRCVFALCFAHPLAPDSPTWIAPARDLIDGLGFTSRLRHPGYIAFLASVFKIAGRDNLTAVRLVQSLLGGAQVILLFFLARSVFKKESVACLAALLLALYPYSVFQSSELLSESFNSFLLVLFFILLYSVPERPHKVLFSALSGLAFTAAILVKSNIIVTLPFIFFFFLFNRIRYKYFAIFCAAAVVSIVPWTIHNYKTYDRFVLVSLSGMALFHASNPMTLETELATRQLKEVKWSTPECAEIEKLPPLEADKTYRRLAWKFIRSNPDTMLTLMKMRFVQFWRLYPITESRLQKLAALFTSGMIIPLALLGLFLSVGYWRKTFLIWATIFSYNLIHLVFISTLRYRIPLDPLFIIFAAFTIIRISELCKGRKCRSLPTV